MANNGRLFPITVAFPLTPLRDVDAISLICLHRASAMSSARVSLNMKTSDLDPYIAAGSPLVIKWRGNGVDDEFTGYVHSYRPSSDGYAHSVTLIAVGASYPMFNESARVFYKVGIHNVAEAIGDDHRFQVETEPHPVVFDQLLQQDESDWAFLTRLGEEWGYIIQSFGVRLVFRPLASILDQNYHTATKEFTASQVSPDSTTITEFVPSYSAAGRTPLTTATGHGVDPSTGSTTRWTEAGSPASGIFQEVNTSMPVASDLEAEMATVASAARGRFPFSAKATILFPAGKKPFDVYQISHEGSTLTWVIQSIKHVVTSTNYVGEVVFGSDGQDYVGSLPGNQMDIAGSLNKGNRSAMSEPTPVIVNTQPVFVGTGANAVVKAQRWKAQVMQRQVGR